MNNYTFLSNVDLQQNRWLQKIDMSTSDKSNSIQLYRVLDGIDSEFTSQLYDDLILNNFAEEEREEKTDFLTFFEHDSKLDSRRENINIIAVSNNKFVGLLTAMAFHTSQLGYFDYLVIDESVRGKGIGSKIFQAGKQIMKQIAQNKGYDHNNLAVLLTVEKENSIMNLSKGQDPHKRLKFYENQNCKRVGGMPCFVPGIYDTENGHVKPPIDCYDWLISGVNRNFNNGEILMDRDTALQFNIDNLDLQYTDAQDRPATETDTYKKIKITISDTIYAEDLF